MLGTVSDSGQAAAFLPPHVERDVLDRHAGWIVALGFHAALFVLLLNYSIPKRPVEAEPPPIRVVLAEAEEPTPAPSPALEETVALSPPLQAAATEAEEALPEGLEAETHEPPSTEEPAAEASAAIQIVEAPSPPETEPLEPQDDSEAAASAEESAKRREETLARELAEAEATRRAEVETLAEQGSRAIADRLQAAEINLQAKKWLSTTDGLEEGVLRNLDVTDVSPEVADRVLARYGIKVVYMYLDGQASPFSFLNQAATAAGTYYNRAGRGLYQAFTIPQRAIARMVELEAQELRRRQADPARTRILEVLYGIIDTPRGPDLGIKRLEAQPVEPAR